MWGLILHSIHWFCIKKTCIQHYADLTRGAVQKLGSCKIIIFCKIRNALAGFPLIWQGYCVLAKFHDFGQLGRTFFSNFSNWVVSKLGESNKKKIVMVITFVQEKVQKRAKILLRTNWRALSKYWLILKFKFLELRHWIRRRLNQLECLWYFQFCT